MRGEHREERGIVLLNKDIRRYRRYHMAASGAVISFFCKLLAVVFALIVPLVCLSFAANLTFRIPDTYNFDLERTLAAKEINLNAKNTEIAGLISDYLLHKRDDFQMRTGYQGIEKPVFTINDGIAIGRYRLNLDRSFIAFCIMLPLSVLIFLLLYHLGRQRYLRRAYWGGVVFFLLLFFGMAELVRSAPLRFLLIHDLLGVNYGIGDVLPQLFGDGYRLEVFIAISVISALIMLVGNSLTRMLTKEERLFTS